MLFIAILHFGRKNHSMQKRDQVNSVQLLHPSGIQALLSIYTIYINVCVYIRMFGQNKKQFKYTVKPL